MTYVKLVQMVREKYGERKNLLAMYNSHPHNKLQGKLAAVIAEIKQAIIFSRKSNNRPHPNAMTRFIRNGIAFFVKLNR